MSQKLDHENLREEIVKLKDLNRRQFKTFTDNFYVIKSAVRYFTVDVGLSFTSTKVSKNFPMSASVAGSCLGSLEKLGIIEPQNSTASPKRYVPSDVNLAKILQTEEILKESMEIKEFEGE